MTNSFCIIGAGGFGLMTALHLRETFKDASITIFDINKNLSSTVNGGNGSINYNLSIPIKDIIKSYNFYPPNLLNISKNYEFYIIHLINYIFNNSTNRAIINEMSLNEEPKCTDSNYHSYDYWDNIINKLLENNIQIKDMTEIIDYKYKNNKITIISKTKEEYICDKLILCTGSNLNLIKNKYYHKFIEIFSGYSSIIKVKNQPQCFYYKDGIFITPYNNDIKITFKLEIGTYNKNYYLDKTDKQYNNISNYIKNNPEIQKLGLISIENIWRGSRAMTYDITPFIEIVDTNVYWISGGGYMGAHMADTFGKWLVELINNKPFTKLSKYKDFNPKFSRLVKINNTYYLRFYLISIILLIISLFKK